MTVPTSPTHRPPSVTALAQAGGAAASTAARSTLAPGARRMPPVNRAQRTEWMNVPVPYTAPTGRGSAEWPIVDTYARLVWRADEWSRQDDDVVAELQPGAA